MKKTYFIFLTLVFLISLFIFVKTETGLHGDGVYYFVYLRSAIFDQDLDFENDLRFFQDEYWVEKNLASRYRTPTDKIPNPYPTGLAIFWLPFYLIGHLIVLFFNLFGTEIEINGTGFVYETSVLMGSIFYGFFGILFCFKFLKDFFSEKIAFTSTITVWLGTNLVYYIIFEPFMAHAVSFFTISLFIFYWWKLFKKDAGLDTINSKGYIFLGIILGLASLVRWQNILFAIIPLGGFIFFWQRRKAFKVLKSFLLFSLFTFLVFLPQFFIWKIIYGQFFLIPQGEKFINLAHPQILNVLFSAKHGLFSWTPIILFAILGLIIACLKKSFQFTKDAKNLKQSKSFQKISLLLFFAFLLQLYLNSSLSDFSGGSAFGQRRFVNCALIFAFGLAALIAWLSPKVSLKIVSLFCLVFIIWNLLFIQQYRLQWIPHEETVSFTKILKNQPRSILSLF